MGGWRESNYRRTVMRTGCFDGLYFIEFSHPEREMIYHAGARSRNSHLRFPVMTSGARTATPHWFTNVKSDQIVYLAVRIDPHHVLSMPPADAADAAAGSR